MTNSKISALTSATTPLVGTETLPIVQGGATVKTTVANITNGGGYAGSFTTLSATGNTTLGDASTDYVTVNGFMGVGGAPVGANVAFSITNSALTNPNQFGLYVDYTSSSAATTAAYGAYSRVKTAAAAYTVPNVYTFYAADPIKGASSAITNQHGLYIVDQTQGTNNYGITSTVSSGTNKYNIYASGTADNYFAGNVGIGTTSPSNSKLDIASGNINLSDTYLLAWGGSTARPNIEGSKASNYLRFSTGGGVTHMNIDSAGNVQVPVGAVMPYAPAPTAISAAATLTNANIQGQIISATGTTYTITMPLGSTMETLASWLSTNIGYDFFVINTATGVITMAVNTGVTSLGSLTVAIAASAHFRIRRTAANTFVLYRLS